MLDGKFAPGDSLVCHPAGGELLVPSKKSVSGALSVVQGIRILGKGGQGTVCLGLGMGPKKEKGGGGCQSAPVQPWITIPAFRYGYGLGQTT